MVLRSTESAPDRNGGAVQPTVSTATPPQPPASLAPVPAGAHALEWMRTFNQFQELWRSRDSDEISNTHPQATWVWSQRKRHREGTLPLWKRQRLEEIDFPLVPTRPTNTARARELVAFYQANGHYSPTQTEGGAALAKWYRLFVQSGGTVGLQELPATVDPLQDLEDARRVLEDGIPGFEWRYVDKAEIHASLGLTHNGCAHSPPGRGGRPSERTSNAIDRIRAGQALRRKRGLSLPPLLVQIAGDAPTGLRLSVWDADAPIELSLPHPEGLREQGMVCRFGPNSVVARGKAGGKFEVSPGPFDSKITWSADRSLVAALWRRDDGLQCTIDIDVPLADQMNANPLARWRMLDEELDAVFLRLVKKEARSRNWVRWAAEVRLDSVFTTANRAFHENMEQLEDWLATLQHPGWLRWNSSESVLFKFVEHQVRKKRQGVMPTSHAILLRSLNFYFGSARKHASEIF